MMKIAMLLAALTVVSPVWAQLGSQSFPAVDFLDESTTRQEIEIAQASLPDPGILPDSPLYFLKRLAEGIREALTFDNGKKAALHLEFAKMRLSEAKTLSDGAKNDEAVKTVREFSSEIEKAANDNAAAGQDESPTKNIVELRKNIVVLTAISEKVPEPAKIKIVEVIARASEKSRQQEESGSEKEDNGKQGSFRSKQESATTDIISIISTVINTAVDESGGISGEGNTDNTPAATITTVTTVEKDGKRADDSGKSASDENSGSGKEGSGGDSSGSSSKKGGSGKG